MEDQESHKPSSNISGNQNVPRSSLELVQGGESHGLGHLSIQRDGAKSEIPVTQEKSGDHVCDNAEEETLAQSGGVLKRNNTPTTGHLPEHQRQPLCGGTGAAEDHDGVSRKLRAQVHQVALLQSRTPGIHSVKKKKKRGRTRIPSPQTKRSRQTSRPRSRGAKKR